MVKSLHDIMESLENSSEEMTNEMMHDWFLAKSKEILENIELGHNGDYLRVPDLDDEIEFIAIPSKEDAPEIAKMYAGKVCGLVVEYEGKYYWNDGIYSRTGKPFGDTEMDYFKNHFGSVESLDNIEEASYSAKSAASGHDIGKPGKNFDKIAKSAGKEYGSKEAGERVAGAVLKKLRNEDLDEGYRPKDSSFDTVIEIEIEDGYMEIPVQVFYTVDDAEPDIGLPGGVSIETVIDKNTDEELDGLSKDIMNQLQQEAEDDVEGQIADYGDYKYQEYRDRDIDESEDDFDDLNESFEGFKNYTDKLENQEGALVGNEGKIAINTKSSLPSHDFKDRMNATPVETKPAKDVGFEREKAPSVVDSDIDAEGSKADFKPVKK